MLAFDLDPGPPAGLAECCEVAVLLRDVLRELSLESCVKTSGSKGMQLYAPLNSAVTYDESKPFANGLARLLEKQHPKLVVSSMSKELRKGKVFIDWSQNDRHKTTVGVYSLRARERPTVSTPLSWDEVERADADALVFDAGEMLDRVEESGDLFEPVLDHAAGATRPLAFVRPMVDWGLARQIARLAARSDDVPDLGMDIAAVAREIEPAVVAHAGLEPATPLPPAEVVGRQEWADANLSSLSSLLDPVAERLEGRFDAAGPFAGALRAGAGVTLAAEVGLVTGYMSQRVLGQYELSLLGPDSPPRLLFVAPEPRPRGDRSRRRPGELPALGHDPRARPRAPVRVGSLAARPPR